MWAHSHAAPTTRSQYALELPQISPGLESFRGWRFLHGSFTLRLHLGCVKMPPLDIVCKAINQQDAASQTLISTGF
jgi:hypothetical protein